MTTLVTPSDLRARAKKLFDRDARTWAAEQQTDVVLDVPLRPPTEREALDDLNRVRPWVDAWRGVGACTYGSYRRTWDGPGPGGAPRTGGDAAHSDCDKPNRRHRVGASDATS